MSSKAPILEEVKKKNFNEKKKTILPSQTDLLTMSYKNKTSKVN